MTTPADLLAAPEAAETKQPISAEQAASAAVWAAANGEASRTAEGAWRRQVPAADAAALAAQAAALKDDLLNADLRAQVQLKAAQLVRRGYTHSAIARAAQVTPQTAAAWAARADPAQVAHIPQDEPHHEPLTAYLSPTDRYPVPAIDADRLVELQLRVIANPRDKDAGDALDVLCGQLRRRGYTLQAVANVIDVTREMVRQRAKRVPASALVGLHDEVKAAIAAEKEEQARQRSKPLLTEAEVARAKELMPLAKKRRSGTPPDSPAGRAHLEYVNLLLAARDRGVTEYMMAKQLGLTVGGVRFKLQRVTGDLPPSMRPGGKPTRTEAAAADMTASATVLDDLEDEVAHLLDLLRAAEIRPGRGPMHAGRLEASRQFDEALADLVTEHRVRLDVLAAVLGRSRASLAMRLANRIGVPAAQAAWEAAGGVDDDTAPDVRMGAGLGAEDDAADSDTDDLEDDDDLDAVLDDPADLGTPDGSAGGVERAGYLTDFTPDATPSTGETAPAPAVVDPAAQHASNTAHMALMRQLREAVTAGGHPTLVWDLGQDVSFTHQGSVVNVEVKSVAGAGAEQYRLGVGQLLEQIQHHLDHLTAGTAWYVEAGVTAVVGVLVVTDADVDEVWRRLGARLGIAVWTPQEALAAFADPHCPGLPPAAYP